MHGGAERAVLQVARARGLEPADLVRRAERDEQLRQDLVNHITVGTTWFMRERAALAELIGQLVDAKGPAGEVTLWSAGCSSGEEAYSLAMLARVAGLKPRVLATDVSTRSLRRAIEAVYPEDVLTSLPRGWAEEFFEPAANDRVRIAAAIRRDVVFEVHNLAHADGPPRGWQRFDAVVCRNVLMYFPKDKAVEVVRHLLRCCRGGGFLLLGPTERPLFWAQIEDESASASPVIEVDSQRRVRRKRPTRHPPSVQASPPPAEVADGALARRLIAASQLFKGGRHTDALAALRELAHEHPNSAPVHLEWGLCLKRMGRAREAVHELRVAAALDPVGWLVEYQLGTCLESIGEAAEARSAWAKALRRLESGARSGHILEQEDLAMLAETVARLCRMKLARG